MRSSWSVTLPPAKALASGTYRPSRLPSTSMTRGKLTDPQKMPRPEPEPRERLLYKTIRKRAKEAAGCAERGLRSRVVFIGRRKASGIGEELLRRRLYEARWFALGARANPA